MQLTQTGVPFDAEHIADQILAHAPTWLALMKPLVVKTMEALASQIPAGLLDLLTDASDGLDDAEIDTWKVKLAKMADDAINIPKVPDWVEAYVFSAIVGYLLEFARHGKALTLSAG